MPASVDRALANLNVFRVNATSCGCCLPCMQPAPVFYLDIRVRDAFAGGVAVPQAAVRAQNGGTVVNGQTDAVGDVILRVPNAGPWTVEVNKDWFVPEPAGPVGGPVALAPNAIQVVAVNLEELQYFLRVDGDRDGNLDNQHEGAPALDQVPVWAWGPAPARGAILLFNNDDDDRNPAGPPHGPNVGVEDCNDAVVNPANDATHELAPLRIHRQGPATAPSVAADWRARLEVLANHGRIRIFQAAAAGVAVAAGDAQVAGAGIANGGGLPPGAVEIPLRHAGPVSFPTWDFAMEATSYAMSPTAPGFDGVLTIRLVVSKVPHAGGARIQYFTGAEVRVAPWMMPHHADNADTVYVANMGTNLAFRQELAGVGLGPDAGSPLHQAACALVQHPAPGIPADIWLQDCLEIGNATVPHAGGSHQLRSVMRTQRDLGNGGLGPYPRTLMRRDFGYHFPTGGGGAENTYDAGGNIEVTPPVRDKGGKLWRWGRIYHGPGDLAAGPPQPFNAQVDAFLQAQAVQSPFVFDTSWLEVGHVDEVLSFVPVAAGADLYKRWRLLVASPKRAYEILAGGPVAGTTPLNPAVDALLTGRRGGGTRAFPGGAHLQTNVTAFLANAATTIPAPMPPPPPFGPPPPTVFLNGQYLRAWNLNFVQPKINAALKQVEAAIDIDLANDVIHVPVIFRPANLAHSEALALTADMPNMLVVNGHCLVPRPFGPVDGGGVDLFEQELRNTLGALPGVTIHFIEDWYEYHLSDGEVHCGTNTGRTPAVAPGGGEWWHFAP